MRKKYTWYEKIICFGIATAPIWWILLFFVAGEQK